MRPTIGADEVAAIRGPVLLDVRWTLGGPSGEARYREGHLPGAVWLDFDLHVCGPAGRTGGRHPLPEPTDFQEALRAAGVNGDSTVVVYDDGDGMAAARTWWTLRWAGHERAFVLEGGLPAWVGSGRDLEEGPVEPVRGDFTAKPGSLPVLDADGAARAAARGELVDVRAPGRYRGENEPVDPVAGHIPGAVNVPMGPGARYEEHAGSAFYCGSGVTAAKAALAVAAAGAPVPPVYIGSWSDWVSRGRPVATGEER